MILGVNPRYLLLDPRYNPKGITFEQYFTDPEIMFHVQLEFQDFVRHHMWADHEMGVPEEGWSITVDMKAPGWARLSYFETGIAPPARRFWTTTASICFLKKACRIPSPG